MTEGEGPAVGTWFNQCCGWTQVTSSMPTIAASLLIIKGSCQWNHFGFLDRLDSVNGLAWAEWTCNPLSHKPNSADKHIPFCTLTERCILGFETLRRCRWGRWDTEQGSFCLYFNPFCYLLSHIKPGPNNSPPYEQALCTCVLKRKIKFISYWTPVIVMANFTNIDSLIHPK